MSLLVESNLVGSPAKDIVGNNEIISITTKKIDIRFIVLLFFIDI